MSSPTEGQGGGGEPRRRFPLGVTIATVIAGLLLIGLLLPHVLLYPAQPEPPPTPDWGGEMKALKEQNDALAEQVKQLETLLAEDLCRLPEGGLQKPDGTPVQAPGDTPAPADSPIDVPLKPKSPS